MLRHSSASERFTQGYTDAIRFTTDAIRFTIDKEDSDLDFSEDARASIKRECDAFLSDHEDLLRECAETAGEDWADFAYRAGIDFWLTRSHHGSGYWDGDYPACGDALIAAAHAAGERDAYRADDGTLRLSPA